MGSPQGARVHLKLLKGGNYAPSVADPPVTRVSLGPGEWVLAPGGRTLMPPVIRDVLRDLQLSDPGWPGPRYRITRVQPMAIVPWFGPALLHHTGCRTVLYCRSDQIAPRAAECLTALAAEAAEVVGGATAPGNCQLRVARVSHRDLPTGLHPAVTTVRGSQVTAHVCARLIAHGLAVVMSTMGTEFSRCLAPGAAMPRTAAGSGLHAVGAGRSGPA